VRLPTASLFITSSERIGPGSNLGFGSCSSGTNRLKVFGLKCLQTDERFILGLGLLFRASYWTPRSYHPAENAKEKTVQKISNAGILGSYTP